ncbi:unnamed protein product [Linum trigynum]|uniref:RNase H type-1 domain-containing protein n=1 Tax=Linum trigynum TaxID=586398 RepID=A0AAV2DUN6_9ROSI
MVLRFQTQVEEWSSTQAALASSNDRRASVPPGIRGHTPPPISPGTVLVHFDGATKTSIGGGVGFVGFSGPTTILFAFGKFYDYMIDAFIIEMLALRDALGWCLSNSISNVSFCADAHVIIQMINRKDSSHVLGGSLLAEIQVLRVSMQRVSFHFALRKYNRAAHIVAK